MQITDISATSVRVGTDDTMSLEERFAQGIQALYAQSGQESSSILAAANDPLVASSPQALMDLQMAMSQHSLDSTIYSLVAKHGVDTISTLLKS